MGIMCERITWLGTASTLKVMETAATLYDETSLFTTWAPSTLQCFCFPTEWTSSISLTPHRLRTYYLFDWEHLAEDERCPNILLMLKTCAGLLFKHRKLTNASQQWVVHVCCWSPWSFVRCDWIQKPSVFKSNDIYMRHLTSTYSPGWHTCYS